MRFSTPLHYAVSDLPACHSTPHPNPETLGPARTSHTRFPPLLKVTRPTKTCQARVLLQLVSCPCPCPPYSSVPITCHSYPKPSQSSAHMAPTCVLNSSTSLLPDGQKQRSPASLAPVGCHPVSYSGTGDASKC